MMIIIPREYHIRFSMIDFLPRFVDEAIEKIENDTATINVGTR